MKKSMLILSTLMLAQFGVNAEISEKQLKDATKAVSTMLTLPISGLKAVETNGQIVFISKSGRFVFRGQLYDVWYRKPVNTMREIRDTAKYLKLDQMPIDMDNLNIARFGTGNRKVTVFTDPLCGSCAEVYKEIESNPSLKSDYTFDFIVVPMLGDESNRLSRSLSCINDPREAYIRLVERTLDEIKPDCDSKQHDLTLLTAQVLDVKGAPYFILDNGRHKLGKPTDLGKWLKESK